MSYPPLSTGLISIFKNISRHRLLVITALVMFGVAGAAISRSFAFKANFSRGAEPKLTSAQESRSGVRSKESIALLRFAGLRGAAAPLGPRSVLAPTVTATKADALFTDVDGDLQADPGDTLKYTVTINASGEDATGVTFTDTVDPNMAFVPGSLTATPVAVDDSYVATGNVRISVPAPGVLGNDFAGVPSATISAPSTSANGGNVAVNPNGSFTYNPPAGFEGTDTFSYTLTNASGSNSATVTITVSGMIWFINNTALCPCDGRLTNPFNSLASFQAVNNGAGNNPAANDNIFVYESALDYVGPVTLLAGQRFLGQDSTASLSAMTGLTPPSYSDPLPATNSGNATIVNITSAAIAITVGSGNTLRGFTGGDAVTDIFGVGFGTLTISDVTLNGIGQALNLATGTLAATFGSISSTNSTTTGVNLTSVAGSLTMPTTTVTNPAGIGISVGTSSATLNFGNTTSSGSGGTGVSLLTNTGTITFGALNISPDANQKAFVATDNTMTLTATSGTISTTGNTAVEITRAIGTTPLVITLTSVSTNGGSTSAIILTNVNGGFSVIGSGTTAGSGGTIENIVNADAVALNNTDGLVTLNNMIIEDIGHANDATAAQNTRSGVDGISGLNVDGGLTLDNTTIRRISDNAILGGTNGAPDVSTVWNGLTINNCTIEDTNRFGVAHKGDANNEGTVRILGLRGTVNVTNSLFQRGAEFLDIFVTAGTMTMTVTNSDFLNAYKEFVDADASPLASVGNHGIDVTVQGSGNATVTIGDVNNAALACDFLNGRLGSVRVANDTGATGNVEVTMGRNTFRSNDHSSGRSCTPGCSTADFDFPMAGVLIMSRGADSATFDVIVDRNTFDEATNASGGIGQLTLDMNRGIWQVLASNNTFDTPGNAPWFIRTESNATTAKVKFENNTGIKGFFSCSDASCGGGYDGPGLRALADVQNGGKLDLTIDGDDFAEHDDSFDPGQTFEGRALNIGAANTLCMNLQNNTAPDGYSLEQFNASQTVNVFTAGGSGTCTAPGSPGNCQNALNANNNKGGSSNPNTTPPFVNVFGTINVVATACAQPSLTLPMMVAKEKSAPSYALQSAVPDVPQAEDILLAGDWEQPLENVGTPLSQTDLNWIVAAAVKRWTALGISSEDMARLRALRFEVADLPDNQLAIATATSLKIDQTAAGYGWYTDLTPMDDEEFDVAVPGRELQTTEQSFAFRRLDLLTVVMRGMGVAYMQGKQGVPQHLRPLMLNYLSPAVRRLPDSRQTQLPGSPGRGRKQSGTEEGPLSKMPNGKSLPPKTNVSRSAAAISKAGPSPGANEADGQSRRLMNHASRNRTTAATLSSMLADVMLSIGTLPAGESVTITFNVTVDNPFTGALPQVSNQGTVSGSNFADVLTDDPSVGGAADPTVTPIDLPSVSVAVSPTSVLEDGGTNLVYTFTRTGSTASAMTVNFSVGGTASLTEPDYTQSGAATFTATSGTAVFASGSSTATVTIDPSPDTTVEPDETVNLTVTSGAGYTVGSPSTASGTITNDDTEVSVAVSPASVTEDGATNLVYTFTRVGVTTNALTVNFSIAVGGNNAVFPVDYSQSGAATFAPPVGTVTFGAGSSTATVTVDPAADLIVEPDETVIFTVTSGAGYNVGSPSSATGTITNEDADVSITVAPSSATEDGPTNLVYTFTRTGFTVTPLTVNFSVAGTAVFSQPDYTQTGAATFSDTSGTVIFGAGSSTAIVTVDPSSDTTVEQDETVILTVTSGTGYNVGSPNSATGTITNDDTDVTLTVAPSSVSEDGATNLVYTFTRTGVTAGALTVNFSVGGTAVFSQPDYTQTGAATYSDTSGTVTFGAGNAIATVTVDPVSDTTIEADETVILTLTSGTGYNVSSPSSATGTITNDDADVSVAVAPSSVAEDGATNLVYTFTRTGFTGGALTVNFSVGGTAVFGPSPDDYTQTGATTYTTTSGSVTFAPSSTTATVTVDPEVDATAEADETVIITLTAGASYNAVSPNSATGTILNDDTLVSVVVAPSSTAEGGANLVYTFTRTGPTTSALVVSFSVGGSASFPGDYSQSGATTFAPPNATVTFGAGSSSATVTVTPLTDCTVEGNETVDFTVQPGTGYGVGSPSTASGTITNTPDSGAPTITLIPNVNMTLWPPNHQYESIAVTDFVASASDDCDPSVNLNSVYILKITSDEVENGNGDGNTMQDIVIGASCKTAQLRAERAGSGNGRVYSITFKVKDSVGNFTTATTTVTVRKSPNQPAVDSGTQYIVNSVCP